VVSSSVFRFTRNPMYLGMAVTLLGLSAWMATAAGLLLVPAFCVYMTRFQIEPEERALISLFGREFEQYMQRVRRWH
jgi:protein-S-isoprenylcysteine O-methyltransferase Ste14